MTEITLVERAATFADSIALQEADRQYTYAELLDSSLRVATALLEGQEDLGEAGVALLFPPGFAYASAQWGIWRAGGVAVPLSTAAVEPEIDYVLNDAPIRLAITASAWQERLEPLCRRRGIRLHTFDQAAEAEPAPLPPVGNQRRAMILYTSGTTSKPKGVVTTHANIEAQITALIEAWQWRPSDRIPLFLPLHHIHGIINVLSCALWSGAAVDAYPSFDLPRILARCAQQRYTLFMAVPTIYVKLIQAFEAAPPDEQASWRDGFAAMRLMVSGSAALPASVHRRWTELTGQTLLERYGMTEIGMALSHPLEGERRPGAVGIPLPGVELRLKTEAGDVVIQDGVPGEIQVRGPAVFLEYWNRPQTTQESFDDGWFRTGDIAVRENGQYRIMGRESVDIIKSGGYKLSALEIEAALLDHPAIDQCAVVGVPDPTWGEAVAVAVVTRGSAPLELDELRAWCRQRLAKYKIPKLLRNVHALPRNAMGKVTKPDVGLLFEPESGPG